MLADDIAQLIQTDGWGTVGTDLFKGDLPTSPDLCTSVIDYSGGKPWTFFGGSVTENPRVQIKVRGVAYDYNTPRTRIERIYQSLMNRGAFTVNSTRYINVEPIQSPYALGKDENNRWVFVVNFDILKDRQAF